MGHYVISIHCPVRLRGGKESGWKKEEVEMKAKVKRTGGRGVIERKVEKKMIIRTRRKSRRRRRRSRGKMSGTKEKCG